ncbi:MAG: DUF4258 domain-containing protein [bacterium]
MSSQTFQDILNLIEHYEIRISDHGYDELDEDNLFIKDILASVHNGIVLEDYPNDPKGSSVLVLQSDDKGNPIHVVWGIAKNTTSPAVLVTAYRPDSKLWTDDFQRRKL